MERDNKLLFLVSLIDHKSLVDYDVSMQLPRYMMCIWMGGMKRRVGDMKGKRRKYRGIV